MLRPKHPGTQLLAEIGYARAIFQINSSGLKGWELLRSFLEPTYF